MKQAVVSMVVVMICAGILTLMVLYSVAVMRQAQIKILTGEFIPVAEMADGDKNLRYTD